MELIEKLKAGEKLSKEESQKVATAIEQSVPLDQHNAIVRLKNQEIGEMYSEIRGLTEQRNEMSKVLVTRNNQVEELQAELAKLSEDEKKEDGKKTVN